MNYQMRCGDVVPGCEGVVDGADHEEVLGKAAAHAHDVHGLTELDDATAAAVAAAIHPVA
jgi:predicted small metal-binding protein